MKLSDEEHRVLLGALEKYEESGGLLIEACVITLRWKLEDEIMPLMKDRQIADAMYLIIASEGKGFDFYEERV